ncbi:aspartic peptidase domain-containing protein [Chiua virens]|nr:aspartic peptidase domain-containing protein [Chiua virens]
MKSTSFFITILSLVVHSTAVPAVSERTLRIPLQRRSRYTGDPVSYQSSTGEPFLGTHRVAQMISYASECVSCFISIHVAQLFAERGRKYKNTFAIYERNTGSRHPLDTLPRSPSTSPSKRGVGDVPLDNESVEMWYGTITIGVPPQQFTVGLTCSSGVPSEYCIETCEGHRKYDPGESSTSRATDHTFTLIYGSGAVFGREYTDIVEVGGYEIRSQTIGAALAMSPGFWNNQSLIETSDYVADGLAGLAFPEISQFRGETLLENLAKLVPRKVLGFLLSPTAGQSHLTIGKVNNAVFKNNTLVSVPVTTQGYWEFRMNFIRRASDYIVPGSSDEPAIADTGTTLVILPTALAQGYYAGVDGAKCDYSTGTWTVPCASINASIPTFGLGGRNFTVSALAYNLGPSSTESNDCITGIGASDFDFVILGDVFLQSVYTIFDFDTPPSVNFAELVSP